ncbi:MAG: hypothetical protein LBL31_00500 [Spirochaetaceae bacterium]|nr:hypothetical protein [Spirochaetaceae bacterium]
MEIAPQIKAYFEAKDGNINAIDCYFADDIEIEDTGENDIIQGFDNCRKWHKEKSRQYEMKTKIAGITAGDKGTVKVSVLVSGNFAVGDYPFDYYFTIIGEKIKTLKIMYTGK